MFDDTDRGQVGIGTLIVFIALVLVAAIAAGVLINTADLLQGQAQQTGEESTDQVSNNLNIESVTGLDATASTDTTGTVGTPEDGDIDKLEFVIGLGSGSDAIDMSQVEVQVLTDTQNVLLTEGNGASAGATSVFTTSVVSGSGSTTLGDGERIKISIDTHSDPGAADVDQFDAGDSAQITLTTSDGTQTTEEIQISDIISPPEDL